MNDEKFVQIFSGVDDEIIRQTNEDINFWLESREGIIVCADDSRKFSWRTVIASVACTAAAMFGVFVLLLNVGKIGIIDRSANSHQIGLPADAVPFEEAAYAYEGDNNVLKRYEVGDRFGENATITSAKATYKSVDGKAVLKKQKIVLDGHLDYKMNVISFERDENNDVPLLIINIGTTEELGLPRLGDDLEIQTIYHAIEDKMFVPPANVTLIAPTITVDYDAESITVEPYDMFLVIDNDYEQ